MDGKIQFLISSFPCLIKIRYLEPAQAASLIPVEDPKAVSRQKVRVTQLPISKAYSFHFHENRRKPMATGRQGVC